MAQIHMPKVDEIRAQIASLVGKSVVLNEAAGPNTFDESCHTARYFTSDDRLGAVFQADLPVAAYLGGALAMIPAAVAQEAAQEGDLGKNLTDAYSEVANIMAGLLCSDGSPHLRWVSLEKTLGALDEAAKAIAKDPCRRIDLEIDIEGYGAGKITILSAEIE